MRQFARKPPQDYWPPLPRQFDEGFWSFQNGVVVNPYSADSARHKEWQRGWNSAYYQNRTGNF